MEAAKHFLMPILQEHTRDLGRKKLNIYFTIFSMSDEKRILLQYISSNLIFHFIIK